MPEGPEIRRVADQIGRVLTGYTLVKVKAPYLTVQDFAQQWVGCRVLSVTPRGKALLTRLDNDDIIYSHNQLYGRWLTRKTEKEPSSNRSLRLALVSRGGAAYLYSATDIEVLKEQDIPHHPYLAKLGPDILDPDVTVAKVSKRLAHSSYRGRQLAALLLDQNFMAGPGNYLRSEILFDCGLHPRLRPKDLTVPKRTGLARAILRISKRAYQHAGITTEPKLAKRLKNAGERRRHYRHYVFGRTGLPCRTCSGEIVREDISSRSVFYCPECQPDLRQT
jgi:endonuclease VIII